MGFNGDKYFFKNINLLKFENLIKMNENKNWRQTKSVIIYILKILCFIIQWGDLYDLLFCLVYFHSFNISEFLFHLNNF